MPPILKFTVKYWLAKFYESHFCFFEISHLSMQVTLISLFYGISTFMGCLKPKLSL